MAAFRKGLNQRLQSSTQLVARVLDYGFQLNKKPSCGWKLRSMFLLMFILVYVRSRGLNALWFGHMRKLANIATFFSP